MTRTLRLGDTEVNRIGLGTNRLAHTPENVEFIQQAVAAGVNVIDTAHLYTRERASARSAPRSRRLLRGA